MAHTKRHKRESTAGDGERKGEGEGAGGRGQSRRRGRACGRVSDSEKA